MRAKHRQPKHQLKDTPQQEETGIQVLLDDIKQEILVLYGAENHRNPHAFAKKLFTAPKSGRLDISQEQL